MKIMGFESTCDETSVSIVEDGTKILSLVTYSQEDLHQIYGGVIPELACRRHVDLIDSLVTKALMDAQLSFQEIDGFAAAHAPGLMGAILIGLNSAKTLSVLHQKPFFAINHIEAHLYAAMMNQLEDLKFPALGLVVSGGHTCLVEIQAIGSYRLLSTTIDDAIGEAFDKVAKMLSLPYPGGPQVEKLARLGKQTVPFTAGRVKASPLSFSFSGIKTAVKKAVQSNTFSHEDIAASFQQTVLQDVLDKIQKICAQTPYSCLVVGGGVSCNQKLQSMLRTLDLTLFLPPKELSLDNAAMIAGLSFHKQPSAIDLEAKPRLAFWST